ncbi:52 kDa repressor of the inhibitor of the protein kinase-like [Amphiura filiformis]|uniref:52 kDa repressor of the inhibitor of the protein kinase-like n=1 Tax=Amphiura filiformis TaxID=82378 RepID=UPI003B219296
MENARGMCADGAGNMRGENKGCGKRLQRKYPKSIYLWCTSHQLNRVIVQSSKNILIQNMMTMADKVAKFFYNSPNNQKVLTDIVLNDPNKTAREKDKLKLMCRTRWVERHDAFETHLQLYSYVVETLTTISQSPNYNRDARSDSESLLRGITDFSYIATLVLTSKIMGYLKELSEKLQKPSLDVGSAMELVDTVQKCLQQVREDIDRYNNRWYQEAKEMANSVDAEEKVPRVAKRQTQRPNYQVEDAKDYYKKAVLIQFVDFLLSEMEDRFSALQCQAVKALRLVPETFLSQHGQKISSEDFEFYLSDIEGIALEQELHSWKVFWSNKPERPKTISETLHAVGDNFSNIVKILKIAATFPVTSCSCERSISALKRLKTFNRSTMKEERMNGLAHLMIHRECIINTDDVVQQFANAKPRRLHFNSFMSR